MAASERRNNTSRIVCCACMITVLFQGWHANALDFVHEVAPLLKKKCGECHTGGARQGGFSINTRDDLLRGGDSEIPGFISGDSDNSETCNI